MPQRSASERVYRWLLRAYPAGFRRLYADEMTLAFRDCREEVRRGEAGETLAGLWVRTLLDLISSATRERLRRANYRSIEMIDTAQFDSQLAATVDYWSRALRSGYNIKQAFEMIAERAPEPTASVIREALAEAEASGDFAGAVAKLRERVPSEHWVRVIDAVMKQRETGGNLADILDGINADLRDQLRSDGWSEGFEFSE